MADTVSNFVDLADLAKELVAQVVVLVVRRCVENPPSEPLLTLVASHLLHDPNCVSHQLSRVRLDSHQLCHISFLVNGPILVKLLKETLNLRPVPQQLLRRKLAKIC